jgi:hypothetical protein
MCCRGCCVGVRVSFAGRSYACRGCCVNFRVSFDDCSYACRVVACYVKTPCACRYPFCGRVPSVSSLWVSVGVWCLCTKIVSCVAGQALLCHKIPRQTSLLVSPFIHDPTHCYVVSRTGIPRLVAQRLKRVMKRGGSGFDSRPLIHVHTLASG